MIGATGGAVRRREFSGSGAAADVRDPPAKADQQKAPVAEELGGLALDGVTEKLQRPPQDEQSHTGPQHRWQDEGRGEQHQRYDDDRNADGVTDPVYRVPVAPLVPGDPFVPRSIAEHGADVTTTLVAGAAR